MEYRELGRSGIRISVGGMGCDYVRPGWDDADRRRALAAVDAALAAGINFFDTAERYGQGLAESVLGEALAGRRDRAVISTKVSRENLAPADLKRACAGSLERLRTDYIDLYQLHWPNPEVPLADTMGALAELKAEGKIRAIGVSNFTAADLDGLAAAGRCETNQLGYGLLFRAIEFGLRQKCAAEGIGIICYSPLLQGVLTDQYDRAEDVPRYKANIRHFSRERPGTFHDGPGCEAEMFRVVREVRRVAAALGQATSAVALAWVLAQPGVTAVLAGARTPAQAERNAAALEVRLPPAALAELTAVSENLKQVLGPNINMWS